MTSAETTAEDEAGRSELSRNWAAVFLAIGLASGFAVYFILEYAASDPWEIGPSLGLLTSAAAFCLAVEPRRWWPAAAAAGLAIAGLLGLLTTLTMLRFADGQEVQWYVRELFLILEAIIVAKIALPFIQCWQKEGRLSFPYPRLFAHAWNNCLILIVADVFTAFFWLIIVLFAQLFLALGIDFLDELTREPAFFWPATTTAAALALYAGRDYTRVVMALRRIVFSLFSVLAPVFLALSLVFVALLVFGGFEKLSSIFSAAATLAILMVIGIILFNALLRDGSSEARSNRLLSLCALLLAPALAVLAGYAVYAIYLRIDQYGLTPDRVWAAAAIFVLSLHAAAYTVALAARQHWSGWCRRANIWIAGATLLLALALLSPWGDPYRVSAENQYRRLASGAVDPETFDYGFLKFDLGSYGEKALARIAEDAGLAERDVVAAQLAALEQVTNRWQWRSDRRSPPDANVLADPQRVMRRPADLEVPDDIGPRNLHAMGHNCGRQAKTACLITAIDLTEAEGAEFLFAISENDRLIALYLIERDDAQDGGWRSSYIFAPGGEDLWQTLLNGTLEAVPPVHHDLKVGDTIIRLRRQASAGVSLIRE